MKLIRSYGKDANTVERTHDKGEETSLGYLNGVFCSISFSLSKQISSILLKMKFSSIDDSLKVSWHVSRKYVFYLSLTLFKSGK